MATFTDDYSWLSKVQMLKQKSGVAAAVRATIKSWEIQVGMRVKTVRTDRGTEYVNTELTNYIVNKGITHHTTAPDTPEQNGVAERLNRTLMERVKAMLFDSKLEESFLGTGSTYSYLHQEQKPIQPPQHTDAVGALLWQQARCFKHESVWN